MKSSGGTNGSQNFLYPVIAVLVAVFFIWLVYSLVFFQPSVDLASLEGNGHFKGGPDAKVRIVEFSDFECPACVSAHPVVKQVLAEYGDKIKFTFRHYPLPQHSLAPLAAEAAECAGRQGKFWEMSDVLFEKSPDLGLGYLKDYAAQIGLETSSFNSCLSSGSAGKAVADDISYGSSIGIDSTPTFFINGEKLRGWSYTSFKAAIEGKLN